MVVLAVLAAVLTVPVYLLGANAKPPRQGAVEAVVRLPAGVVSEDDARREVLDEANLGRAVRKCGLSVDGRSVRNRLRVWASKRKDSKTPVAEVHIACSYESDAARAVALANQLAEQFAESVRARLKARNEAAYRRAKKASSDTQKALQEAQERFDRFMQEVTTEPQESESASAAVEAQATASDLAPTVPAEQQPTSPASAGKKNPDWLAIRRQLDQARQYRDQLLIDRTPLHPAVRAADAEIVELEKRLAAIPDGLVPPPDDMSETVREMTDPLPEPLGPVGPARKDIDTLDQPLGAFTPPGTKRVPAESAKQKTPAPAGIDGKTPAFATAERLKEFLSVRRELVSRHRAHRRAVTAEREAWQRQLGAPAVEVIPARAPDLGSACAPSSSRRAILALMVALAVATGIGMLVSGIADAMTFPDAARARAVLPVPVLATVTAADHAVDRRRRRRLGEAWVASVCGLVLLAASTWVVLSMAGVAPRF
jgi:hypothetical protein